MGNGEPGTGTRFDHTTTTVHYSSVEPTSDSSEKRNEHVVPVSNPPPDVVLESLPSRSTGPKVIPLAGIDGLAGTKSGDQEVDARPKVRSKVKHGHSRTRQRNIHCLETEV